MDKVEDVKQFFREIDPKVKDKTWCEGYVSALEDEGSITQGEREELVDWIVSS